MAQFLADIAGMLEIFMIAAGFVVLHRAAKDASARLLQVAGAVLLVGGIAGGLCTGYYWFTYRSQGGFDHATSTDACSASTMMQGTAMGHRANGMGPGMMGPGIMGNAPCTGTASGSAMPPASNLPSTPSEPRRN